MRQKRRVADSGWISFKHDSRKTENQERKPSAIAEDTQQRFISKRLSHLQHIKDVTMGKKLLLPAKSKLITELTSRNSLYGQRVQDFVWVIFGDGNF